MGKADVKNKPGIFFPNEYIIKNEVELGVIEEKFLLKKAAAGDEQSFERLIESNKTKAYNLALSYMKNEFDAQDVVQDSYIKVFRNLRNFKGESSFDTWVYRIVVNTCKDYLRKRKDNIIDLEFAQELEDEEPGPEAVLESKLTADLILKAMDFLTLDHREIIILRDIRDLSYEEIAYVLDCSVGTVKSRINRAREKLKTVILELYGDIRV